MDDDLVMESMGGGGGGKRQQQGTKYHRTIQSDGTYLTLRHAFGVEGGIRNNVAFVTVPDPEADGGGLMLGYLLHPVGQQVSCACVYYSGAVIYGVVYTGLGCVDWCCRHLGTAVIFLRVSRLLVENTVGCEKKDRQHCAAGNHKKRRTMVPGICRLDSFSRVVQST